ncbi:hypothetical protein L249_2337, partial [Ophiocordyceps polyrhachis-furcata BCC 54312]
MYATSHMRQGTEEPWALDLVTYLAADRPYSPKVGGGPPGAVIPLIDEELLCWSPAARSHFPLLRPPGVIIRRVTGRIPRPVRVTPSWSARATAGLDTHASPIIIVNQRRKTFSPHQKSPSPPMRRQHVQMGFIRHAPVAEMI